MSKPLTSEATLTLHIAPNPSMSFSGASCNLKLQQSLFPIDFWLATSRLQDMHFNQQHYRNDSTRYPASANEVANLQRLATHFSSMLPHLDGLLAGSSLADQLVLRARSLKKKTSGFETEIESLAPAVALIMQYLITTANWNMTAAPTEMITSLPIRWYVYGSGPRMVWQWATGAVVAVLVLTISLDVFLIL